MRDDKGQFPKGVSGNPAGRKKGVKNRAMSDRDILNYLGKRLEHCYIQIEDLAQSTYHLYTVVVDEKTGEPEVKLNPAYDPKLSFNIYSKMIDEHRKAKEAEDKKKMLGKKGGGKKEEVKEDEPDMSSVVSGNFRK